MGRSTNQQPYFTMKLVRGRTLAALLRERSDPRQDLSRIMLIFEQVCQTMAYAHSQGVIHRDLKPANVMVGAFGEVQVMDWGLAKVLSRDPSLSRDAQQSASADALCCASRPKEDWATQAGAVLGTPSYMAPEQAAGEVNRLDERCDVFGLGAMLCEILTGRPPYIGADDLEVVGKALHADLAEALARLRTCGADPDLIRLATQCLTPILEDRPRDAGMLAAEMAAHRESIEVRLRHAELAEALAHSQMREQRKRWRLTLGLAASVCLTVVVGGGAWLWRAHERAERERQEWSLEREWTQEAEEALALATRLREEARSERVDGKWAEARAQVQRAKTLLERLSRPSVLNQRIDALLRDLNDEEADRRLVRRLEDVRIFATSMGTLNAVLDSSRALPEYRSALRDYGITVGTPPRLVGARIRQRPDIVQARVLAALDDWLILVPGEGKESAWLAAVLSEAGPDPWRQRLRVARRQGNRADLERLAAEPGLERRPAHSLVVLCQGLLGCGAKEQALALLRRAQCQYPDDFWINCFLGWQLGQFPRSRRDGVRYLSAAVALRPNTPTLLCLLGIVLADSGDKEEALAVFRRATALSPEFTEGHHCEGKVLFEMGDLDGGIAAFERAQAKSADIFVAVNLIAKARIEKGDREGAAAAWRRALALKLDASVHSLIEIELGRVHIGRRQWQQAAACYGQSLKRTPTQNVEVWFEYAALLLLSGDEAGYRKTCADLVRRCDKTSWLRPFLTARACTLAAAAAAEAARAGRIAEPELKKSSAACWSLTEQAAMHHRAGRFAQALALLEQSLKASDKPGNAVLNWLWLALTYHRLGKTQEARSWLEKATKWLDGFRAGVPARAEKELGLHLHDWLEVHILRREAETLLEVQDQEGK
jgi:serine/threonine-protein kinase